MRIPGKSSSLCFIAETLTTFPIYFLISSLIFSSVKSIGTQPSNTLIFSDSYSRKLL